MIIVYSRTSYGNGSIFAFLASPLQLCAKEGEMRLYARLAAVPEKALLHRLTLLAQDIGDPRYFGINFLFEFLTPCESGAASELEILLLRRPHLGDLIEELPCVHLLSGSCLKTSIICVSAIETMA